MNFEQPSIARSPESRNNQLFLQHLEIELSRLIREGKISHEQADDKRRSAAMIESGLSDDPRQDAILFSQAGIADATEIIESYGATSDSTLSDIETESSELSPKDIFVIALNRELTEMVTRGVISSEAADEKRRAASLIETAFSDDPEHDAMIFAMAGIANEDEMIEILGKK